MGQSVHSEANLVDHDLDSVVVNKAGNVLSDMPQANSHSLNAIVLLK
jgi:hypothetical protein